MDDYEFVSGIPMIGTLLVLLGLAIEFRALVPTALAAVATMLDTGGSPWFLLATWRDRSFWDN